MYSTPYTTNDYVKEIAMELTIAKHKQYEYLKAGVVFQQLDGTVTRVPEDSVMTMLTFREEKSKVG